MPSGGEVRYWIEAKDNDTVGGPNIGRSRELRLRVVSPRERHEETLGRQQEVAEKLLRNLGGRLTLDPDDAGAARGARRASCARRSSSSARSAPRTRRIRTRPMRCARRCTQMRDRLDRLATAEQKLLPKPAPPTRRGRAVRGDRSADDRRARGRHDRARRLARSRALEGLLDVSDEIAAHQKRLAELLAQYQRTKDPRLLDEIEREMKALERAYAELDKHRRGMRRGRARSVRPPRRDPGRSRARAASTRSASWSRAGKTREAQRKLEQCRAAARPGASARSRARSPGCAATSSPRSRRSSTR